MKTLISARILCSALAVTGLLVASAQAYAATAVTQRVAQAAQAAYEAHFAGDEALEAQGLTKRERMVLAKEFERLTRSFAGMRNMNRLPGLLFIVDPTMEENAVHEANRAGIPIIAMCDTNADPDLIQFPIPSNDDAIRAIQLMTARVADAALEGMERREQEVASLAGGVPAAGDAEVVAPPRRAGPAVRRRPEHLIDDGAFRVRRRGVGEVDVHRPSGSRRRGARCARRSP